MGRKYKPTASEEHLSKNQESARKSQERDRKEHRYFVVLLAKHDRLVRDYAKVTGQTEQDVKLQLPRLIPNHDQLHKESHKFVMENLTDDEKKRLNSKQKRNSFRRTVSARIYRDVFRHEIDLIDSLDKNIKFLKQSCDFDGDHHSTSDSEVSSSDASSSVSFQGSDKQGSNVDLLVDPNPDLTVGLPHEDAYDALRDLTESVLTHPLDLQTLLDDRLGISPLLQVPHFEEAPSQAELLSSLGLFTDVAPTPSSLLDFSEYDAEDPLETFLASLNPTN